MGRALPKPLTDAVIVKSTTTISQTEISSASPLRPLALGGPRLSASCGPSLKPEAAHKMSLHDATGATQRRSPLPSKLRSNTVSVKAPAIPAQAPTPTLLPTPTLYQTSARHLGSPLVATLSRPPPQPGTCARLTSCKHVTTSPKPLILLQTITCH